MYTVKYRMYQSDTENEIVIPAHNKAEAYDKAVYELIPAKEGTTPYSAWVYAKTCKNGKYTAFSYTMEGYPY